MTDNSAAKKSAWGKLLLLLAAAAVLAWACYAHRFRLNDQRYMLWDWRHLPSLNTYGAAAALSVPFFLGQWLYAVRPSARGVALLLISLSTFALMIAFLIVQWVPPDFRAIGYAVTNISNGGYLAEGAMFQSSGLTPVEILRRYPQILPNVLGHAYNKPPGLGMIGMWIVGEFGLGPGTPTLVGLIIALIAAASVPAAYLFIAHFTGNRDAAFCGASFLALCPSILLFFPTSDQLFPPVTVLLTLLWSLAMQKNRLLISAAFGVALAITFFFAYLPAVLIVFLLGVTVRARPKLEISRIALHAALAIACVAVLYFLFWLATGFDPIATFISAWKTEHIKMAQWCADTGRPPRRLPGTIWWDLVSFAMGSGWIGILLAIYYFLPGDRRADRPGQFRIALLCAAQILIVALVGILPGETVRYWMFMLPMLMLPVGLELSRWPHGWRIAAYGALLVLSTVICQSMIFIV